MPAAQPTRRVAPAPPAPDDRGRAPVQPGASLEPSAQLSVSTVATWHALRQCARFLRLHADDEAAASGPRAAGGNGGGAKQAFDAALAASGHRLEADVKASLCASLCERSRDAPARPIGQAADTPFAVFLELLADAPPPPPQSEHGAGVAAAPPVLGTWAAEVMLADPVPGPCSRLVRLNGRADFILLLWRNGAPVLRIVECKASSEPQTKHLVQLALYRMLLLELLQRHLEETGQGGVMIGGREWSLPGDYSNSAAGGSKGAGSRSALAVECMLCVRPPGAGGGACNVMDSPPQPDEDMEALCKRLKEWMQPGGRIAEAMCAAYPATALQSYELGSHCASCPKSEVCWERSARDGDLQLASCTTKQVQRLRNGGNGMRDIEDLAALAPATAAAGAVAAPAAAAGTDLPQRELEVLTLTARVRAQRTRMLHAAGHQAAPQYALLPGAPPSVLPQRPSRHHQPLVRVYVSVVEDLVLRRIVGVAAHVAQLDDPNSAPRQANQAGQDVVELLRNVDSSGAAVLSSQEELDRLEAQLLDRFSAHLRGALVHIDPAARLPLHFYFHSHAEQRLLLSRCLALDRPDMPLLWLPHVLGLRAALPSEQCMASVMEDELKRYVTVWHGSGRLAATSVDWDGSGTYAWRAPGGGGAAGPGLRTVFAPLRYLHSLQERPGVGQLQLRYDLPYSSVPPSCFRALWGAPDGALVGPITGHADPAAWEQTLRALLAAQAHAVRWLEERLVRLPTGGDADLRKLKAPLQLGENGLRGFRIPVRVAGWLRFAPTGPHVEGATELTRAALDAALLDRRAELSSWWNDLARLSPAVRACEGRDGAVVLGDLQTEGRALVGRVVQPAGCRTWQELCDATGFDKKGSSVIITSITSGDPDARQERAGIVQRRAHGMIKQHSGEEGDTSAAAGAPLYVTVVKDPIRYPPDEAGCFVLGTPDVTLASFAQPNQLVVADAAPNIGGWVVDSVVDCLQYYGASSRYLAERLRLPDGAAQPAGVSVGAPGKQGATLAEPSTPPPALRRHVRVGGDPAAVGGCSSSGAAAAALFPGGSASCTNNRVRWCAMTRADELSREALNDLSVEFASRAVYARSAANVCATAVSAIGTAREAIARERERAAADMAAHQLPPEAREALTQRYDGLSAVLEQFSGQMQHLSAMLGATWAAMTPDGAPRAPGRILPLPGSGSVSPAASVRSMSTGPTGQLGAAPAATASSMPPSASVSSPAQPAAVVIGSPSMARGSGRLPPRTIGSPLAPAAAVVNTPLPSAAASASPHASVARAGDVLSPSVSTPGTAGAASSSAQRQLQPRQLLIAGTGGGAPRASEQTAERVAEHFSLHPAQRACVQAFVAHPEGGSRVLLQGPPGTGKTETLAASVLAWLAARMLHGGPMGHADSGGVILLSGPTHTAIDTVAKRIYELLQRIAEMGNTLDVSEQLVQRAKLVRLSGSRPICPERKELGAQASVPTTLERGVWYIVAGTLRHLVKAASDLRTKEAKRASAEGARLMEDSGKGAFASALLLDEASMVFAPQLLALGSLLVARASLLVAGDHRQLAAIIKHDFVSELRPNLLRYSPHVSAYDYVQRLAAAKAEAGGVQVTPPPIAVCALTFSVRLPAVVRSLISPLYALDGITLEGRPPAAPNSPAGALSGVYNAAPAPRPGAAGPDRDLRTDAAAGGHVPHHPAMSDATAAMMRRVWQLAEVEGLFLIVHYEAESSRSNDLEVEIVRQLLLARPQAAPAGDGGGNGGGGAGGAQADGGGGGGGGGGPGAAQADGGGGGDGSIAIITPHRAQRRALQALVQELGVRKCTTETVERMQGGQADTVIFSATVSDVSALERASEFYTSLSRANTAFSRAQQRLIVVVSRTFLVHLPQSIEAYKGLLLWRKLQGMCQQRGKLLGEVFVGVARGDAGAGGGVEQDGAAAAVGPAAVGPGSTVRCDMYQAVA